MIGAIKGKRKWQLMKILNIESCMDTNRDTI